MFRSFEDFQLRRPLISDFLIGFRPLNGEYKVYFGDVLDLATSNFIDTVTLSAQSIARSITGTQFFQTQSTYTTVNTNSGRWYNTFLPLSGGILTGDLLVQGSLSALGEISYIDTKVIVMSALTITNPGTGPAIVINQIGAQPIAEFQDDGTPVVYIVDGGNVGIRTTNPSTDLHVIGNVTVSNGLTALSLSASQLTVSPGTSAVPAISPTDDTNTGLFFPAADTIAFTEGGTEIMRIDSSGRVGIKTTLPLTDLHVIGDVTVSNGLTAFSLSATSINNLDVTITDSLLVQQGVRRERIFNSSTVINNPFVPFGPFSQLLDLSATNAGMRGYNGGFTDGRYGYFVPFLDGVNYHGRVARVQLFNGGGF